MNQPIGVIGDGAWGTALAYSLSKRVSVALYLHDEHKKASITQTFKRKKCHVLVTPYIDQVFKDCQTLVLALPFQSISNWFHVHGQVYDLSGHTFINASKGVSAETLSFFHQIIPPNLKYGVLSGPSFADEVLNDEPTTLVFASEDKNLCQSVQTSFSHETLRIYVQHDPVGVCVGGSLKNVLAIGSGIAHGIALKKNAVGALVTRGIWEIASIAKSMGGNPMTVFGLSGLGDILLSCYSTKSRNMIFGKLLGQGVEVSEALEKIGSTVEGYPTTRAMYQLAKQKNLELPICEEIFYILYKQKNPKDSLQELMNRPLKHEMFQ
jgi:glycerol-3-phosphate dehydrogenase (NAD(P)+)